MRKPSQVTIDLKGEASVVHLLQQLPRKVALDFGPLDRAVKAATSIIARRARRLAPDSSKTGTKLKQSQKKDPTTGQKQDKFPVQVKNTIRSKVILYPNGAWGIVGPKSPEGNAAHFMQEKPRRHVLWGKATAIKKFRIERNWITQAFDETKSEQLSAMEASLKRDIDENMRAK